MGVSTVMLESVDLLLDEWISLLEVSFCLFVSACVVFQRIEARAMSTITQYLLNRLGTFFKIHTIVHVLSRDQLVHVHRRINAPHVFPLGAYAPGLNWYRARSTGLPNRCHLSAHTYVMKSVVVEWPSEQTLVSFPLGSAFESSRTLEGHLISTQIFFTSTFVK